jgi:type IV secretion system protein TrbL
MGAALMLGPLPGLVAGPIFQVLADVMAAMTAWFVSHILDGLTKISTPKFDGAWWSQLYSRQVAVASIFALILLLLAAGFGAIRGDGRSIGKAVANVAVWGLLSAMAPALVGLAVAAVDYLTVPFIDTLGTDAGKVLAEAAKVSGSPVGVQLVGFLLIGGTALLFFVELVGRDVILLLTVAFAPIALAGIIWSGSRSWAQKAGRLLAVALLSKFLIIAIASIGLAALSGGNLAGSGFGLAVAGAVVLAAACWAPWSLLKHAPGGAPAMHRGEMGQATGVTQAGQAAKAVGGIAAGGKASSGPKATGARAPGRTA